MRYLQVLIVTCILLAACEAAGNQKSLDFIRAELAKNEDLKVEELRKYIRAISPAYIIKKGDRTLDNMALDSVKENRFEYHRFLVDNQFQNVLNPDLPNFHVSIIAFIFVLCIVFVMIVCSGLRRILYHTVKKNVSNRINEICKDMLVLLVAAGVLKVIDYFELIPVRFIVVLVNDIQLLLSEFCVLYVLVNISCIIYAQLHIAKWVEYEKYIPDRVNHYRTFERLYIESLDGILDDESKPKYEKLKKVMKFISLRQEFLSPTFVPLLRESVLRDDFKFSDYLGKAYYKTLRSVASLRRFSLMSFLLMFFVYLIVVIVFPEKWEVFIMGILSVVFFVMMFIIKVGSQNIFYRLSRPMSSPYEFQVQPFDAVRNPYANLGKILTPYYLRSNFENTYVSNHRLINPQDNLFLYSSPNLCLRLLHLNLFVQIIWMIIFYTNYMDELSSKFRMLVFWVSTILSCISMFYFFPIASRNFALITNIEMMKDKNLIEEVIAEQKSAISAAFVKFYRLVKSIRKEKFNDQDDGSPELKRRMEDQGMINLVIVLSRVAFNKLKDVRV